MQHDTTRATGPAFTLSVAIPKFSPGQVVSTPGALAATEAANVLPLSLLKRHLEGDWGDLGAEDAAANDAALDAGDRLLSAYRIAPEVTIWIITEADRSVTTLLLPEEY